MPFLFVATVSSLFYLLCLKLGSMDFFQSLLSKMGFSLGSRVLLSRGLAREGWLLLVFILAAFGIFDGTIMNMTGGNETVNQGPHRGDAGPSSIQNSESDSGSWRKYLTLSSEREVNQTPGRQAPPLPIESGTVPPANAVAFSEAGPSQVAPPAPSSTPSNSSTWSGPWIERWLYPAEAEAPAEVHQREELIRSIHAQIKELVRQHCERPAWKKGLSRFPGQAQLYIEGAENIMNELEISAETDTETLREWVESLRRDPNLLKPLIKDHFPD